MTFRQNISGADQIGISISLVERNVLHFFMASTASIAWFLLISAENSMLIYIANNSAFSPPKSKIIGGVFCVLLIKPLISDHVVRSPCLMLGLEKNYLDNTGNK